MIIYYFLIIAKNDSFEEVHVRPFAEGCWMPKDPTEVVQ